ncbi:MAG: hypothetical protein DIZ80_00375 [endosymbiont of Galathealinum brachiosum]|uniref:Uncharacterized protein n=1 Tax=endosymbiont of Galathealinum brachiosum TaxID=2200906 RepID=A0A370DP99_9GAMM|nr:MAG: hypothetical protein DIZ80_00375 [endosymbiont of Galathealinum brachiosum]
MNHKKNIENHLNSIGDVIIDYIRLQSNDGQASVKAAVLKKDLGLDLLSYSPTEDGQKGWLMSVMMEKLVNEGRIEYFKVGSRYQVSLPSSHNIT